MNKKNIDSIAYLIRQAKENNKPRPIVFLGAGASFSAHIPLAKVIREDILKKYAGKPEIKNLEPAAREDYYKVMGALNTSERNELLRDYITSEKVKINVSHIYLAQLLKEDLVDYVVTVNFDDLMLRACALFNFIPPVYDVAILDDFTTTTIQKKSITFLHGQYHGLWLLNTPDQLEKVKESVETIFTQICHNRTWIIVGYSGEDEVLDKIVNLNSFDNDLFWVGYLENEPSPRVKQKLLDKANANAFWVSGYHSDSFFMQLHAELSLPTPQIFNQPFSFLRGMLDNVTDIASAENDTPDHKKHIDSVKERLQSSKSFVDDSINRYELSGTPVNELSDEAIRVEQIKQEIRDAIAKKEYEPTASELLAKYADSTDEEIRSLLSTLYFNWGTTLMEPLEHKNDETSFPPIFEKFEQATSLNKESDLAFNNWGVALGDLALLKKDPALYAQSFEKLAAAVAINPLYDLAYSNWGIGLLNLAKLKEDEAIYLQSMEKYAKATEINPRYDTVYNMWGIALSDLAELKKDKKLREQSIEKYRQATLINPNNEQVFNNWANSLARIGRDEKNEQIYSEVFEKYARAVAIQPANDLAYDNWGMALYDLAELKSDEGLYLQSVIKYVQALTISPNNALYYTHWGNTLFSLGVLKEDEATLRESFEKYSRSLSIDPQSDTAWTNWGNALCALAHLKKDEQLYREAFEKFARAIAVNPKNEYAYASWGAELAVLARLKSDPALFKESFEKFEQAVDINPLQGPTWHNWSTAVIHYARLCAEPEKRNQLLLAKSKSQRAVELGESKYNLACSHALLSEKAEALKLLAECFETKIITKEHVLDDEDWNAYKTDPDFLKIIPQ